MSDLGTDAATPAGDLDAVGTEATGILLLAQDLAARIETPRGGLYYDPDYGYGLIQHLGEHFDPADEAKRWQIEDGIAAECGKDERVRSVEVELRTETIGGEAEKSRLLVEVRGVSSDGPFRLVIGIEDLTLELLEVGT